MYPRCWKAACRNIQVAYKKKKNTWKTNRKRSTTSFFLLSRHLFASKICLVFFRLKKTILFKRRKMVANVLQILIESENWCRAAFAIDAIKNYKNFERNKKLCHFHFKDDVWTFVQRGTNFQCTKPAIVDEEYPLTTGMNSNQRKSLRFGLALTCGIARGHTD